MFHILKQLIALYLDLSLQKKSNIPEHMMIKTQYMKNLLDQLEANTKLSGQIFRKKIFMVIDGVNISIINLFSQICIYSSLHLLLFSDL